MQLRDSVIKFIIAIGIVAPFVLLYMWQSHKTSVVPIVGLSNNIGFPIATGGTPTTSIILTPPSLEKPDLATLFILEAYDKIMQVHWKARSESEMLDLFSDAYRAEVHATGTPSVISPHQRTGFIEFLIADFIPRSEEKKKTIAIGVVTRVLAHLEPFGRNQLMSQHEETALRQLVSNIDTKKDLYQDVGVPKGAPATVVEQKFEEKKAELEASTTPTAKVELEKITYAKNVLTNVEAKARYDTKLIEPTVFSHEVGNSLLYVYISKIAPTTKDEFVEAILRASTTPTLNHLVIDLRGNIGGALDFPLSFFGSYVGKGEPVLLLTHQNATWTEKTIVPKMPELERYTKQIVITNKGTQSTAEVVSAYFKRKKLALLMGEPTAGWGTVENTYPMQTAIDPNTKYILFLVHSLTLGADDQPIQGKGVPPDINVSQVGWEDKLSQYLGGNALVQTLYTIMTTPPER